MIKTKINGKWELLLPEHRAARPEWTSSEGWEKPRMDHMSQNLNKDDILFYIGAEEGDLAALCAQWVDEIVLFEPNPKVWPNIKAIWQANTIKTPLLTIVGFASDKTRNFDYNPATNRSFPECANGELIGNHGFMELRNHNAPEVAIDYMSKIGVTPTALSIDVEGSKWHVLRGAEQTLKEHKPKIWLSLHPEFMYEHYKLYAFDLRNWIKDLGYKETFIDYQHEVHLYYEAV